MIAPENEDAVEKAIYDAFDGGKYGFISSQTAEHSPVITEQEYKNYLRMIDIWEEISPI